MTKLELLQAIGDEVCEGCADEDCDCGIGTDECSRLRRAETILDEWFGRDEEIAKLEDRLSAALPNDEDGMFGTDGSHEELMGVFERAFGRAESVARDAIKLLKSVA